MVSRPNPSTLFSEQISRLTIQLDAVREGGAASVHDARVTTRRVRELLELADGPIAGDLNARLKTVGRILGTVRDVDVRIALLTRMESRLPPMAPALFSIRLAAEQTRPSLLRKAIKQLEEAELPSTSRAFVAGGLRTLRHGPWDAALRQALVSRGRATRDAIDRASGVYFPNRIHAVRIALKKMRYGMEIATATRTLDFSDQLRVMRKAQDVLGDLHDRQTLRDDLDSVRKDTALRNESIAGLAAVIEAEIQRLHARYLSRRAELVDLSHSLEIARVSHRWRLLPAVATGAVAIASGLYFESAYRVTVEQRSRESSRSFAEH